LEGRVSGWLSPLIGGVGGIALVLSSGLSLNLTQLPPIFAVLSSAVLIGGSYVYTKKRLLGVCPVAMAAIQFVTAFMGLACVSLLIEGRSDWIWTRQSLLWDAILASFGNALAFPLYYFLLQRFESFQLTSAQWVVTLVSVTESLIILRQRPSWEILVGFVLIGASLWILLMRHSKEEEPLTIRITHPPFEG
jgi:drug/metabolite transporter (DMT)-like permease